MGHQKTTSRRSTLAIIYFLCVVLMILRIDWWWWGDKIYPLMGGWLSIPMLYQLGIWLAGTCLVFWLCIGVWEKNDREERHEQ